MVSLTSMALSPSDGTFMSIVNSPVESVSCNGPSLGLFWGFEQLGYEPLAFDAGVMSIHERVAVNRAENYLGHVLAVVV